MLEDDSLWLQHCQCRDHSNISQVCGSWGPFKAQRRSAGPVGKQHIHCILVSPSCNGFPQNCQATCTASLLKLACHSSGLMFQAWVDTNVMRRTPKRPGYPILEVSSLSTEASLRPTESSGLGLRG